MKVRLWLLLTRLEVWLDERNIKALDPVARRNYHQLKDVCLTAQQKVHPDFFDWNGEEEMPLLVFIDGESTTFHVKGFLGSGINSTVTVFKTGKVRLQVGNEEPVWMASCPIVESTAYVLRAAFGVCVRTRRRLEAAQVLIAKTA